MNDLSKLSEAFGKKAKKDEKEEVVRTSFFRKENVIYEQISTNQFIDSTGQLHTEIFMDGYKHLPNTGEELQKGVVLLPNYTEDYLKIEDLIADIRKHIHKYYDCDEQTEKFSAWYVLLSWVFDRLNTINYLRAMGDYGTGKSRFSDVVGRICYKPIIGSGAGSVAALKRMVNKWRGTVISDEGDFKEDDEKNELVKFYNLGFEKNRSIYQCNKNDPNKIEFYIPFCPKIILTRRDFKDKALESRCLTHVTKVTTRKDIPVHLPNCFYDEEMVLRNKLLKFRFDYYFEIDSDKVLSLNLGEIEPRLKQAMASYAVLFANIPKMFEDFVRFLHEYNLQLIEDRSITYDGMIVNIIVDLLNDDKLYITCSMILEHLSQGGFNTTVKTVGSHLKQLGIKISKAQFIEGKTIKPIILDSDFIEVASRYVSDKDKITHITNITNITDRATTKESQELLLNKKNSAVGKVGNIGNVGNVKFDTKTQKRIPCEYPKGEDGICGDDPCNELEGHNYCQNHFELLQERNNEDADV